MREGKGNEERERDGENSLNTGAGQIQTERYCLLRARRVLTYRVNNLKDTKDKKKAERQADKSYGERGLKKDIGVGNKYIMSNCEGVSKYIYIYYIIIILGKIYQITSPWEKLHWGSGQISTRNA